MRNIASEGGHLEAEHAVGRQVSVQLGSLLGELAGVWETHIHVFEVFDEEIGLGHGTSVLAPAK